MTPFKPADNFGLKTAHSNVGNSYTAITNASIARHKTLYKVNTVLVPVASAVKAYVKSLYGASSPEFNQINKIAFKVIASK